jgi:hypothetical protein
MCTVISTLQDIIINKVPSKYWQPEPALADYFDPAGVLASEPSAGHQPFGMTEFSTLGQHWRIIGGDATIYRPDGTSTAPYITVVAASSLAILLGAFNVTSLPGHSYSEFWDDKVLTPYNIPKVPRLHCPLVAMAEGFS